jgi:two-component system, chemotaxis family, sensor kinase Cph1
LRAELARRRILVVEDEALIAMDLEWALRQRGCEVVGPLATVGDAVRAATTEQALDGALLDVNLGDEHVFPVADVLAERGVPFLFLTGYEREIIPARHRGRAALAKPYRTEELVRLLAEAIGQAQARTGTG